MITFAKTATKPNYLFGKLPLYFKENDSYVPNNVTNYTDRGLLERFLEVFCLEIDGNIKPYLDNIGYLYDVQGLSNTPVTNPDDFINHIAETLGNPPDIGSKTQYKNLLAHLVSILKVKGTKEAIDLYLAIFGYKISTIGITPLESPTYDWTPSAAQYDSGYIYDNQSLFFSEITLEITDYDGLTTGDPGNTWLTNSLKPALENFIIPMYTSIVSITYV